jgi:regulator of chromosome condensation
MLQLGIPDCTDTNVPRPCKGLNGVNVVALTAGGAANALVTIDEQGKKKVLTFGTNDAGALGRPTAQGDDDAQIIAASVPALEGLDIVQVSVGDCHMAALTAQGQVYTWGCYRDANGMLGFAEGTDKQPTPILIPELKDVVAIESGENSTVALTKRGEIYIWGDVRHGQRLSARVVSRLMQLRPLLVLSTAKFDKIVAGGFHYFARTTSGQWYTWGLNNWGQLGLGKSKGQTAPKETADNHAEVESFYNKYFQSEVVPVKFPIPKGVKSIKTIAAGQHHSLMLDEDGNVYAWGRGEYGQIGNGKPEVGRIDTPHKVEFFSKLKDKVVHISCGDHFNHVVTESGKCYAWGYGDTGALGMKDAEDATTPEEIPTDVGGLAKVPGDSKFRYTSGGSQHTLFVTPAVPVPPKKAE